MNPTLSDYVRHAQLFGGECVFETALEIGLHGIALDRLRVELDAIEANRKSRSGRFTVGKRRRRSELETARYAVALAAEFADKGLSVVAVEMKVADKLGVSDAYARRVLRLGAGMHGGKRSENGAGTGPKPPHNPFIQAEKSATKAEARAK